MFTFGRERYKETARARLRDPRKLAVVESLIDAVHDVVEGTGSLEIALDALRLGLSAADELVWNEAAIWLAKVCEDHPQSAALWDELAASSAWHTRFNIAASLPRMGFERRLRLMRALLDDSSAKVRTKAASAALDCDSPAMIEVLEKRMQTEHNTSVVRALQYALPRLRDKASGRAR